MKALNWIGKLVMGVAAVLVIAGAGIWLVNRVLASRLLPVGEPVLDENFRSGEFGRERLKEFDSRPRFEKSSFEQGLGRGFDDRRVPFGFDLGEYFHKSSFSGWRPQECS